MPNEYLYYYYHREKALANILKSGATRGQTIEQVNKQMMEELKAMDMDADPEGALQIFLYYMQVRENSYMSIESGLAKRPLLEKGSWKCLMAWDMQALCLTASRGCRARTDAIWCFPWKSGKHPRS